MIPWFSWWGEVLSGSVSSTYWYKSLSIRVDVNLTTGPLDVIFAGIGKCLGTSERYVN